MNSREIKLIALDLDGTVLNSEKKVTSRTRETIASAAEGGIQMVIASGRSRNGAMSVVSQLSGIRYLIASNGASVVDLAGGRLLYDAYIDPCRAADLLDQLWTIDVMADIYYSGGAVSDLRNYQKVTRKGSLFPAWFIDYFIANREPVEDLPSLLRAGQIPDVEKITASFEDMGLRERAFSLMRDASGFSIVAGSSFNMEISQENATKGKALTALAKTLGIDMKHVMAIGDTENDVSMIEAAGLGVAMGNAQEEIQAIADHVTVTNDEDGVALAIEHFAL